MSARVEILRAADELFGEIGFEATTTREIAQSCGVNKALIHYHFAGKRDLFNAVLDRYYEKLEATLDKALLEEEASARDRLWRVVDTYVDFLTANRNFSRIVQREAAGGKHLDRVVSHMLPIFERGVDLLQREYPAARDREFSGAQLLISFYGMVVSYFSYSPVLEVLLHQPPLTQASLDLRKRHLRRMLDLVVDTLEAEG
jgi:TetR/AcrR family transcriptional regulator